MGIQKTPYQKLFQLRFGLKNYIVDFVATNRQFDQLEISIVSDKSNKHNTVYGSYNYELARTTIQSIEIENMTNTYSIGNKLKNNVSDDPEKCMLCMQ